jgi:hypothetical protein
LHIIIRCATLKLRIMEDREAGTYPAQ